MVADAARESLERAPVYLKKVSQIGVLQIHGSPKLY